MKLPDHRHNHYLVVVKGFGMERTMLLTSCSVKRYQKESMWRIVGYYLSRWKCDEPCRYIKECHPL